MGAVAMMLLRPKQAGFTLIELAIVLVIIGVLAGSFISTLSSRIDNTRIADTRDELELAKQAMIGYAISQPSPYLPCPDCINAILCPNGTARDGIEDRQVNGSCSVGNRVGTLPWVTLGLAEKDAWGNRYRYWVDNTFARDGSGAPSFTLNDSAVGIVERRTNDGTATETLASNVAAVLLSHGKNGFGAISSANTLQPGIPAGNVDEQDNVDLNAVFIKRPPTDEDAATDGGPFDDIVIWIPEYELKAKMVEAGALP